MDAPVSTRLLQELVKEGKTIDEIMTITSPNAKAAFDKLMALTPEEHKALVEKNLAELDKKLVR